MERLIRAFQVLMDSDKPVYEVFSKFGVMKSKQDESKIDNSFSQGVISFSQTGISS